MTPIILVTGCGGPAGVNTIRGFRLTFSTMKIYGCDSDPNHLAFVDGLVDSAFVRPSENYIDWLNQITDQYKIDLIIPQPDPEVLFISENREKLHAEVFLPSKETIRICQDKELTAKEWTKAGLFTGLYYPIRKNLSRTIDIYNDLEDGAKMFGGFPTWLRATKGAGGRASTKLLNVEQGYHWMAYWLQRNPEIEFIEQPFFEGRNYAWTSLWYKGQLISSQGRERLEYIYPNLAPSGVTGTPSIARTIHNKDLNKICIDSVLAIDSKPTGIMSVDCMEHNGMIIPTEINAGRFFTTNLFFTQASFIHKAPQINLHRLLVELFERKAHSILNVDCLPENLYWVRHIDCGERLLTQEEFDKNKLGLRP
jgi:carbamoyl-phosphate synthase large subunit